MCLSWGYFVHSRADLDLICVLVTFDFGIEVR